MGNKISPGNPSIKSDGTIVHTLWGELAWQLGGREAYERVRADDEQATSPGDLLRVLFNEYGPCLILIDEWVAYARQLHDQSVLPAGSFETQFSFAQVLKMCIRDRLRGDNRLMRRARSKLKARRKAWDKARQTADLAAVNNIAVTEPGPEPTLDGILAELERERLFKIIEELVKWENTNNETVLQQARDEIWQSWRRACAENADHPQAKELFDRHKLPAFHDPFAGGGSLPLEAQRLGLEAYASDLNPVAVLINKAMIEIPPKFAGCPPVNPEARKKQELSLIHI